MNNYIELALRTNSHIVGKHGRNSIDSTHACLGLVTELYELENTTDVHNWSEEAGDIPDAQRRNIKKLYSRYPESFDARLAIVRDIDAELKAMHDA